MSKLVVLDTNVLISAGINPSGPPAQIVKLILQNRVILVTCPGIVTEYLEVCARPKFKRFGFPPIWVHSLIKFSHQSLENPSKIKYNWQDPHDAIFYELALAYQATLITGNLKHFPADLHLDVKILSPRAYCDQIKD